MADRDHPGIVTGFPSESAITFNGIPTGAGKPLARGWAFRGIITGMWQASKSHPPSGGFQRFTLDIPAQDHSRFKSLCALHATTMRNEIQAMVGAQIATPDVLVSALLTRLQDAAQARGIPFEKLLAEVLRELAKKARASGSKLARPA